MCGIDNGVTVRFYKYHLRQFTIGNINMKEQDIWITFDERITNIILGMDILKQIIMTKRFISAGIKRIIMIILS